MENPPSQWLWCPSKRKFRAKLTLHIIIYLVMVLLANGSRTGSRSPVISLISAFHSLIKSVEVQLGGESSAKWLSSLPGRGGVG